MGAGYLIDTNAIIHFSEGVLPRKSHLLIAELLDDSPLISVITKIELLGFSGISEEITELVNKSLVLGLTEEVIDRTIGIRRKKKIRLPDAIVAATALTHGLVLISNNTSDFTAIKGLKLLDPLAKP